MPTTHERWNSRSGSNGRRVTEPSSKAPSTTSSARESFARSANLHYEPQTSVLGGLRWLSLSTKPGTAELAKILGIGPTSPHQVTLILTETYGGQWSLTFQDNEDCYLLAYQRGHRYVKHRITREEAIRHGDVIGLIKEQAWRLFESVNDAEYEAMAPPQPPKPIERKVPFKKAPRRRGRS